MASAVQPAMICRYWVTRNWNETYDPNSTMAPRLARASAAERKMPSRTRGSRLRRSMRTNAPSSAAAPANDSSVRTDAQPSCGAPVTAYTSSSIPRSPRRRRGGRSAGRRAAGSSRGISRTAAASTTAATGAGSSSVHRQLISVSSPDSTRPSEKPAAPKAE